MLLPHMADHKIARLALVRKRLANNLKLFRGKKGMSQEELADRAGLHRTQLSQIERGLANARLDTLVSLAEALGVDEVQLLTEHEEVPTPLKSGPKTKAEAPVTKTPRRKAA
jgi:transcriptional regulator with XRE-family HTH domain